MEFVEIALHLIHEYVQSNIEHLHLESFQTEMIQSVTELIEIQFEGASIDLSLLHIAMNLYPHGRTSLRCPVIDNISEILTELASKQLPDQRTPEWYESRHQMITASVAYKAIDSDAKLNELICSKCAPFQHYENTNTEGPLHWGVKYEPVSIAFYEYEYQTKIKEYGCIADTTYPFLGASPDGVNVLESSPLYGRMLEIKNPFSREITGIPKKEYFVQCQFQMAICKLSACDFLETNFKQYESKEEFDADGTFQKTASGKYKGIILQFLTDKVVYEYAPFQCNEEEYYEWERHQMDERSWIRTIYWKLEDVSCVLILRNDAWFTHHLPSWIRAWDIIQQEKQDGSWIKRLPKTKTPTV
jgi:putative phage-type endonuclease